MTPTVYTERTVPAPDFFEGRRIALDDGIFCLFGMPIPLSGAFSYADVTAVYAERTTPVWTGTERTVAVATPWNERTG